VGSRLLTDGFASSTVTHIKNAVSGVLNLAIDDEIIPTNPAHNVWKIFRQQNHRVNLAGKPYHESYTRRIFYKAIEKAGLRKIRIHDLRHTYASLRISKGDNIADVSKQLGHYSVKFTMDIYYHWITGGKKSEVDGLDDFVTDATIRNQRKMD
jgi:integrase